MKNFIICGLTLAIASCSTSSSLETNIGNTTMTNIIQRMNPPTLPDAGAMGYSQISIAPPGQYAFVSGQVAWQADGSEPPTSLIEQTKIATKNAKAALEAINAEPKDIIMTRVYLVGLTPERIEEIMPVLIEFWDGEQPSLTGVGVEQLAAPDLLIEIEMTVLVPSR